MADLILTDEEKAAENYLNWSDDAIGKAVRKLAIKFHDTYGQDAMWVQSAALMLLTFAKRANSETTTITLEGTTDGDEQTGDWEIVMRRTDKPETKA